jgi:hypothetical protein
MVNVYRLDQIITMNKVESIVCLKALGNQVSSTNKTVHYDIAEILLKVALNTIALTLSLQTNNAFNFVHGYYLI